MGKFEENCENMGKIWGFMLEQLESNSNWIKVNWQHDNLKRRWIRMEGVLLEKIKLKGKLLSFCSEKLGRWTGNLTVFLDQWGQWGGGCWIVMYRHNSLFSASVRFSHLFIVFCFCFLQSTSSPRRFLPCPPFFRDGLWVPCGPWCGKQAKALVKVACLQTWCDPSFFGRVSANKGAPVVTVALDFWIGCGGNFRNIAVNDYIIFHPWNTARFKGIHAAHFPAHELHGTSKLVVFVSNDSFLRFTRVLPPSSWHILAPSPDRRCSRWDISRCPQQRNPSTHAKWQSNLAWQSNLQEYHV